MQPIEALLLGAAASLMASIVFWLYFWLLRPNIEIASVIATEKELNSDENIYLIKFINRGFSAITDVEWELDLTREETIGDGSMKRLRRQAIKLPTSKARYIPGYALRHRIGVKEFIAENAKSVIFNDSDLHESCDSLRNSRENEVLRKVIGDQGFYLELRIFARHNISGRAKLFSGKYTNPTAIKSRPFKPGTTLKLENSGEKS